MGRKQRRQKEQSERQKSIAAVAAFHQRPAWKALTEFKEMIESCNDVLHSQLQAAAFALVEADPDVDPQWLVDKLVDIALPPLVSAAQTACRRNGLPHEAFHEDIFFKQAFKAAYAALGTEEELDLGQQIGQVYRRFNRELRTHNGERTQESDKLWATLTTLVQKSGRPQYTFIHPEDGTYHKLTQDGTFTTHKMAEEGVPVFSSRKTAPTN